MFKIFKYLEKVKLPIFIIIIFLAIQAIFDLKLPDYTSKIVNIGIQQNGIENTTLEVISESSLNNYKLFLSDDEIKTIKENYKYVKKNNKNYKNKYSILKEEGIYVLNTKNKKKKEDLGNILKFPLTITTSMSSSELSSFGFDFPKDIDPYTYLMYMDKASLDVLINKINTVLEKLPDTMLDQLSILGVSNEYKKVGLDLSKIQTNYIIISGIKMISISLIIMVIAVIIGFIGSRLSALIGKTLRKKVFEKVLSLSKSDIKEYSVASLITRTTNDVTQIQQIIMFFLRVVIYGPIIAIGGIIKTTSKSGSMGWIIFGAVMALFTVLVILLVTVMPKFKKFQTLIDKLNLVTREILTGIPVIRAFSNEKHEEERFNESNTNLYKVDKFVSRVMALMMPLMSLLMYLVSISIVWRGAYLISDGVMQVGDVMAYIQYAMQIIISFLMIGVMGIMLPRASVSLKRIIEILEEEPKIKEDKRPKKFITNKGTVEFRNVCFRYPDASFDVITDISFKAEPGTTTAFIGSTGSGKSTLINLIPRFYDVTEGKILIDGVDIRNVSLKDLRKKIGYVPQKGRLFTGTIKENIKYGDNKITDSMMKKAAKIAQAEEFINSFEDKYDHEISQGGTNVSGGQRQRLSIARAIAANPQIYIFDDSFSALDFKTDKLLRQELAKVTKKSTVFIVAQRINTILNADQIVVLDEGKVVGIGKHKDLLKTCNVYKEIASSQLSEEELLKCQDK